MVVDVAKKIRANEIGLVEGCRALVKLLGSLDRADEALFLPFIAVEPETDHLPIGEAARLAWNSEALVRYEERAEAYLGSVRVLICEACEDLIIRYGCN
jgi:hypothetical protein